VCAGRSERLTHQNSRRHRGGGAMVDARRARAQQQVPVRHRRGGGKQAWSGAREARQNKGRAIERRSVRHPIVAPATWCAQCEPRGANAETTPTGAVCCGRAPATSAGRGAASGHWGSARGPASGGGEVRECSMCMSDTYQHEALAAAREAAAPRFTQQVSGEESGGGR
jgi:hypothetical protein